MEASCILRYIFVACTRSLRMLRASNSFVACILSTKGVPLRFASANAQGTSTHARFPSFFEVKRYSYGTWLVCLRSGSGSQAEGALFVGLEPSPLLSRRAEVTEGAGSASVTAALVDEGTRLARARGVAQ